ncbi:MAG: glycosyltransferase family 4 protein [Deltaproteobacteria bacterium]|nr:glycosyltransferase family 4 protein [Deltaproteobacteria bacterium]
MTADTVGGVWTFSIELAAALEKKGVQVFLATMGAPINRQQLADTKNIPGLEVFESGFRLEWMRDPWENVRLAGEWLLRLEDYVRPDIIHLNGYSHGCVPFKAPAVITAHSCVLSWWEAVKGGPAPEEWDRYRQEVEKGLAGARAVAAPTRAMLDAVYKFYNFSAPGCVIPNGRDERLFMPAGKKEEFIFTAGRLWDEAKNIAALQSVAGNLGWPVYAAGQAYHSSGTLVADGSMKMLGLLSTRELASWLSRASIFALPALYEPFGLTALEAGLSGAALVLGDIPSLKEIWDGAALFVDPRDTVALKNAISLLIKDSVLRQKLALRARERALSYTTSRMADGYLSLYKAALEDRATGFEEGHRCAL